MPIVVVGPDAHSLEHSTDLEMATEILFELLDERSLEINCRDGRQRWGRLAAGA